MGVILHREPKLENPVLIASWPGIANIGVAAVETLIQELRAEAFGEIEPWDFFYPSKIVVSHGELVDMEFPTSKFYFKKMSGNDLIFFLGEEQPNEGRMAYAQGTKALQLANFVLDIAVKFGCQKVYTSGAAVSFIHHTMKPRVWATPNAERLIREVGKYDNTVLMSDVQGRGGQGTISGLNGLLLGVARKRGLDAICLMGEIPMYLQGLAPIYPKASASVLEVLTSILGITIEMDNIAEIAEHGEREIERLYTRFPPEIREHLDRLKDIFSEQPAQSGPITEEDKRKILDDIDKFFETGHKEGQE